LFKVSTIAILLTKNYKNIFFREYGIIFGSYREYYFSTFSAAQQSTSNFRSFKREPDPFDDDFPDDDEDLLCQAADVLEEKTEFKHTVRVKRHFS